MKTISRLCLSAAILIFAASAPAQIPMGGGSYSQNFNTLATSGTANAWTDNITLPGWYAQSVPVGGPTVIATYRAESGTSTTGALYSFGTNGVGPLTDRALGSLASGGTSNIAFGVRLVNNTATPMGNINVVYTGEQWRNGGNVTPQLLRFSYRVSAVLITSPDANNTFTWTPLGTLDFTSPVATATATALDGNVPANRLIRNGVLTGVTVPPGGELFLRWFDQNDAGNDHGLAIDDFQVTFQPVPPIVLTCSPNILVTATSAAGAVVTYTSSSSGGCPPVNVSCNPPSGSTFPVGTTTVTCSASDACGQSANCSFTVTVQPPAVLAATNNLPPAAGVYVSPQLFHMAFANGIIISNVSHRKFTQSTPPPPLGGTQVHSFGSSVEFDQSGIGGLPTRVAALGQCSVQVTHSSDNGTTQLFDTEMLQLDISGGGLPAGVMLRESPTLQSTGKTTIRPTADGQFMISSFFDIFTELSMDGGATWSPALQAAHVELRVDPTTIPPIPAPTNLLPPPNDLYVSPAQYHLLLANGIVIRNVRHSFFTQSLPPPPAGPAQTHVFDSQVDYELSTDGGATFRPGRSPALVSVNLRLRANDPSQQIYDTEMLQLDLQGGDLPPGTMLRESPTKRSLGGTAIAAQPDGTFRINSFFDIFTEVSLDGGQNWAAATDPARVTLVCETPEVPAPSPNLPPLNGEYVSPQQWHALYAQGIIISNVTHRRFTQATPPPPPGGSQIHQFDSEIDMMISQNNGQTWSHVIAPASVQVRVTSSVDSGATRCFDTEMLALNISGGGLPPGVMVRESPSKASLGRTSIRMVNDPLTGIWDYISSFFDIFTEISLDGGATWLPALTSPVHMGLVVPVVLPPIVLTCSSNIMVTATSAAGALVNYTSSASGGCPPLTGLTVTCVPASGSTFPIGTNTVTCTATDACGQTTNCTFTVIVKPMVGDPCLEPDNGTGTVTLPPAGCQYLSPDQVHMIINGLPPGTTIELAAIHKDFICHASNGVNVCSFNTPDCHEPGGTLGGEKECSDSTLELTLTGTGALAGFQRQINLPVGFETHVGPRTPGQPVQSFDTDMFRLFGQITGDPDFDLLRIVGGTDFGMPSPGHTTLTRQGPPGSGWAVDSFFDITYRIDFVGKPGGPLGGMSGSTTATIRMVAVRPPNPPIVLTCSSNIVVAATSAAGAAVNFTSTASGDCPPVTVSCNPPSGSTFPIGTNTVTCIATDGCGQTTNCSFTVTVNPPLPLTLTCSSKITVAATSAAGAVVLYGAPTVGGGCPPVTVSCNPPSGSTFPIGTNTVTCTANDACGQTANCTFTVTVRPPVPEYFSKTNALPPTNTVYISPALWHALYANGIIIRDVRHRFFTHNDPPPPVGATNIHQFGSEVDFDVSTDNGQTFQPASGTAQVTVRVVHTQDSGGKSFFETEMLQLDLAGPGFILRESPTKASTGQTTVRPVPGGYMISSFFDVFTELSTDNGQNWSPAQQAGHVELRNDPAPVAPVGHPTTLLPPPNGGYVSPEQWHALFAQGIIIRDISHKFFTDSQPPPPVGGSNTHSFNSQVDLQLSTDGGNTYQSVRVAAPVTVRVTSQGSGGSTLFDTEMLSLNLTGLPGGIMIRESPTEPSHGMTLFGPGSQPFEGIPIHSFFDIFTELSLDGGQTWSPATNGPVRMQLTTVASEVQEPTPNLPPLDGSYISPEKWHALYANGIIITNASHDRFTQTQPPPPPGGNQVENFGSRVLGKISMNGGASFTPFSAPAGVSIAVTSHAALDTGSTRFFDTEMLSLSLQGGSLPGAIMVRESPSKASLGRTSVRAIAGGFRINSFFDVFTEVSLDGGATWSPSVTAPGTMSLSSNPPPPVLILTCSTNITVPATSAAGAVVTFVAPTVGGGCPPVTVNCVPVSGSTFPIGTNTVTCSATDECGQTASCTFKVTVNPLPPIVLTCSSNITVNATSTEGAVVLYTSSVSGGCPPVTVNCVPASGSTFPIGTNTVTCTATDACGQTNICTFTVTVNSPIVLNCSSNITVAATSAAGAVVNFSSSASGGCPPVTVNCVPASGSTFPIGTNTVTCTATDACGQTNICTFTIRVVQLNLSIQPFNDQVRVIWSIGTLQQSDKVEGPYIDIDPQPVSPWTFTPAGAKRYFRVRAGQPGFTFYDTEMLQLDIQGGNLPPGMMIRESPTKVSTGKTAIAPAPGGGFVIDSFFDVFTELSMDGGQTWQPSLGTPPHMRFTGTAPNNTLPPRDANYVSPADWHAAYASGIYLTNASHHGFTQGFPPPPPGGSNDVHTFGSTVNMMVRQGLFGPDLPVSAPAQVTVEVKSRP